MLILINNKNHRSAVVLSSSVRTKPEELFIIHSFSHIYWKSYNWKNFSENVYYFIVLNEINLVRV